MVEGSLARTLGRNLRTYREARGLSQEAFADVVGTHRTRMGQLERGECNLRFSTLEEIAARLEVEPVELLLAGAPRK